jgi:chloramphenicol O-acetyltransferase
VTYIFAGWLQLSDNLSICFHTQIHFSDPVSTVDHPKINEWLSLVEGQMRLTLASSLAQAVQDIKQFKDGDIDRQAYMHWCDKYQVGCLPTN